jgi:AraC family transcriptional regulator
MPVRNKALHGGYQQRLNRVISYIQQHMDEVLTVEKLADIACLSPFHFHRIFSAHFNESIYSHIKRIRLERAAMKLQTSAKSITEIAVASGYQSSSAFTKAFRQHFGQSPKCFRPQGYVFDQGSQPPESTLVDLPRQQVIFVREIGSYQQAAGNAWKTLYDSIGFQNVDYQNQKAIGITYDSPEITDEQFIRYDACLTATDGALAKGIVGTQYLAGGRYAVFSHRGAYESIDRTYQAIYKEWLPQSGLELRDVPSFCHYHQFAPSGVAEDALLTDIYLPIEA